MHARNDDTTPADRRHRDVWVGLLMLLLGLLVLWGVWRELMHHDGIMLVVVPAAMMLVLTALLSRHAKRGTKQ